MYPFYVLKCLMFNVFYANAVKILCFFCAVVNSIPILVGEFDLGQPHK